MRHRLRKRRLHSVRRSASAGRAKRRIGRVLRGWMPGLLLVPGLCLGPVDPGFAEESNDSVPGTTEDAADPRWTGPLTAQWQHDLGRSIEHPLILNEGALIVTTTDRRIVSLDLTGETVKPEAGHTLQDFLAQTAAEQGRSLPIEMR